MACKYVALFLTALLQLQATSIVFIHLGKTLPPYLPTAIRQARLFNKECAIYLIHNEAALIPGSIGDLKVVSVPAESLQKSRFHASFLSSTNLDKRSLDGFWFYTTERFYYLHEFIAQYKLEDVFHLENDVMLYCDLADLVPVFRVHYQGRIAATYEGVERCVPGFLYISRLEPMDALIQFMANRVNLNESDMDSVGRFINDSHKIFIDTLPVVFPSYGMKRGFRFPVPDDRFSNHFEAFDSLFDAAAMGQYLGGDSPVHTNPTPGFINLLSVYDSSHFTFEWELDQEGRKVPYILFEGEKKKLNNLHIHSKNLEMFRSRSKNLDIITNWPLSDMEIDLEQGIGMNIRTFLAPNHNYRFVNETDKVIVMNPCIDLSTLAPFPKEKRVLFIWEPDGAPPNYCQEFGRVYTFNDDLIDHLHYFKNCFPSLHPLSTDLIPFEERKLCTMIAANWKPERIKMVQFFDGRSPNDFDFYGQRSFTPYHRLYRGKIPGGVHFGAEKIATLKKYRFCICFENSEINGYISEKIFGCFTAGCIPIYLGAPNIEDYIPKSCFIDYRDFNSDEEVFQFIKHLPKEKYLDYIQNIQEFLNSEKAQQFSLNRFYEIVKEISVSI